MPEDIPPGLTPFVFSDPRGKRWPRLRLFLLIGSVVAFFATVLFVQTLFIAPRMTVPFSLRQLKGQLKSLAKINPAGKPPNANSLLWQKFEAAKQAARKVAVPIPSSSPSPTPMRPRRKTPDNEVRLAFYTNGDPYSYSSLEQHSGQITHVCPEWMSMVNGVGDLQIDADIRIPKLAQNRGIALMPLLTNLVGDTWQPEAVENVAHGPPERQENFIRHVLAVLRDAKASGVVIDWEQLDPAYKKDFTLLIEKFADALHREGRQLWLCVSPGQELDYIDFDELSDYIDRFVALLFDETSDVDPPGPLASRMWFEGWLHVLLEDSDPRQWIIALGSYGYDWTIGGKKAELISFPEAMSRASNAEIVTVDQSRANGMRTLEVDKDKYLTASYTKFPEFPTLYHQGAGGAHEVALTFDDGPDPEWTPKILDILKATKVKAAFFLVGVNAERYPKLVRRIVDEGHEIGNHTYYHPNLALCWPEHIRVELNATQLLIQSLTGRATTLFRPPYAADTQPSRLAELIPLQIAQDQDYMVVLENIDPQDWAKPGADVILQRIKQQRHDGSIVLLHDAGGNRSQTVQALPRIIDWLQTRGDTIVPLSMLLGTTRDALMPPLPGGQSMSHYISSTGFRVFHAFEEFLWAFMIVATALVVIRTLIVIYLAYRFRRLPNTNFAEPATVVIAAYNEGKVIAGTLRSLLKTEYAGELEVIVIDDGSSDDTSRQVERMAQDDQRVRLIQQENRGKARALQRGLAAARNEVIVVIDADTPCRCDTLSRLLAPFSDANIGAVSGHAKVGNLRSFIARCQSLEYTVGFNLDRRAYTRWNCITVVPGAISAIRRRKIERAGGISLETLAEDTDLTLTLHKQHMRIVYVPDAIAWTEAPETVRALSRQRFRWAYGTLQCLWKHRDMVFNWNYRALGWFSLPRVWFCQFILF